MIERDDAVRLTQEQLEDLLLQSEDRVDEALQAAYAIGAARNEEALADCRLARDTALKFADETESRLADLEDKARALLDICDEDAMDCHAVDELRAALEKP